MLAQQRQRARYALRRLGARRVPDEGCLIMAAGGFRLAILQRHVAELDAGAKFARVVLRCLRKQSSRRIPPFRRQSNRPEPHQGLQVPRIGPQAVKKSRDRQAVLPHQLRRRVSLGTGKPSAARDRRMIWRIDAPVSSDR